MRIAHGKTFSVTKLVSGRWTSRQIVTRRRSSEWEEVIALACCVGLAITREEVVALRNAMIDADVVAVDDRVFLAVGFEVAADARQIRQRERIDVVAREGGESSTARTITQVVTGNRRAVGGEDRADRRDDVAAAREPVSASRSWLQQLAEIADTHSGSRYRHAQRIAGTAEDRRTV